MKLRFTHDYKKQNVYKINQKGKVPLLYRRIGVLRDHRLGDLVYEYNLLASQFNNNYTSRFIFLYKHH